MEDILELKGRDVYSTTERATIDQAVSTMCASRVGALVVMDALGRPIGILSERDLLVRVLLAHKDPATTRVLDVMTRKLICVEEDRSIDDAMAIMTEARCRHLPVVNDGIVGIVSIGDLVRAVRGREEFEIQVLHEYIEGRYPG
jgi:CBS domain-containing protein